MCALTISEMRVTCIAYIIIFQFNNQHKLQNISQPIPKHSFSSP
jgi:hypothetical protein